MMANKIRGEIKEYDIIVVGTGAGNIVLEHAMEAGLKAAQVEKGKFGGTCLTRGCIPTKVMVTATEKLIKSALKRTTYTLTGRCCQIEYGIK